MHLKLNITNSDITRGERANPSECAIARSIKRNKKIKATSVSVFYNKCIVQAQQKGKTVNYVATMPEAVSTFIHRFDHCKPVNPFRVELSLNKARSKDLVYLVK